MPHYLDGPKRPRPTVAEILHDPTTSTWLKNAITSAVPRDALDAVNDAEFLAEWLRERLREIQS